MIVVFPFIVTVLEGNQFISSYIYVKPYICLVLFFLLLQSYITDQALFFICVFCIVVKAVSQITHWVITSPSLNKEYCIVLYCIVLYCIVMLCLLKLIQGQPGPCISPMLPVQASQSTQQWICFVVFYDLFSLFSLNN